MDTKKENLILFLLASINFCNIVDFMIMMPLGPRLMNLMQITPQQFSFLVSAYTFSAGTFGFLASFFVDKFDRKHVLMFAFTGFTLGTITCGLAPDYHLLLFARVFTGIFGGMIGSVVLSIVSDIIPLERRATAMGKVMAAFSLASIMGVPLGLAASDAWGWNAPFLILGCIATILFVMVYVFIPSVNKHVLSGLVNSPLVTLRETYQDSNRLIAMAMMILILFGQFSIIPFISPSMVYNVGFKEEELKYIYFTGGLFTVFTSPIIGKWADKSGKLNIMVIFTLLAIIPIYLITNIGTIPIYLALAITTFFFMTIGGRMIPAQALSSSVVHPHQRGSFLGITASLQQLAAGIASYGAGMIITKTDSGQIQNYEYLGYFAIATALLSLLAARKIKPVS